MSVRIAIIGDLNPSYPSHQELEAARAVLGPDVETVWIGTTDPRIDRLAEMGVDPALWLHALDTPPRALYYLNAEELGRFHLVTDPPKTAAKG